LSTDSVQKFINFVTKNNLVISLDFGRNDLGGQKTFQLISDEFSHIQSSLQNGIVALDFSDNNLKPQVAKGILIKNKIINHKR